MASAPVPAAPDFSGYPVQLDVTPEREINRLWGIPFLGNFGRWVLAIPHLVVLGVLGFCLWVWFFLGWIPILVYGRVPGIAVSLLTEYIHRGARVGGYIGFLMPGGYPPLEPGIPGPIDVQFDFRDLSINRLWGIPAIGLAVRVLVLIPQIIVLALWASLVVLSLLILWIPILTTGTYPDWAASFYGGFMRYAVRLQAYLLFLPVPYPPLWLD